LYDKNIAFIGKTWARAPHYDKNIKKVKKVGKVVRNRVFFTLLNPPV